MRRIRTKDEKKGIFLLVFIFALLAGTVVYFAMSLKSDDFEKNLEKDQVMRSLAFITDENDNVILSNVLIYYPVSMRAVTVNIPGNIGAIYQILGKVDRIDEIYKQKGIEPYIREIEKLLGCQIPFYINIRLNHFARIADMLGGFRIFVPEPIDMNLQNGERILVPSGAVNLDGDKVLSYIKAKPEEDDFSEEQARLQNVINSFYSALHEKRTSVFVNNAVYKKYASLINSNLDSDEFFKFLRTISELDSESIIKQTVTGRIRIVDDKKLLFPFQTGELIKESVKQSTNMIVTNSSTFASRIYVLEIKNGTTIQGLAHNTSILYQGASYDVLSAMNADSNDYAETIIIDHIGNPEAAAMVGEFIRCTNIQEEKLSDKENENSNSADVDFTIILGRDFDGRYVRH